jgi:hypothetical protein
MTERDQWQEMIDAGFAAALSSNPPQPELPKDKLPTDCGVCTMHLRTKECRRHAPSPGHDRAYLIALWNFTRDSDRCGRGSTTKAIVDCDDCTNWHQPNGEPLWPDYKQGYPDEWWAQSGLCTASSPSTTINEGLWTFWKVTSMFPHKGSRGGCGDGISIKALLEAAKNKAEAAAIKAAARKTDEPD